MARSFLEAALAGILPSFATEWESHRRAFAPGSPPTDHDLLAALRGHVVSLLHDGRVAEATRFFYALERLLGEADPVLRDLLDRDLIAPLAAPFVYWASMLASAVADPTRRHGALQAPLSSFALVMAFKRFKLQKGLTFWNMPWYGVQNFVDAFNDPYFLLSLEKTAGALLVSRFRYREFGVEFGEVADLVPRRHDQPRP